MTAPSPPAAATLAGLFAVGCRRALAPGETLFHQGDAADRVFLIERGRVRMIRHLASGEAVAVHTGRAGELFAEGALFAAVYQCDGLAPEAAVVVACAKEDVLEAFAASFSLGLELLERVTRQLHAARALVELRDIRSAEERVLRHLRLRADAAGVVAFEGRLLEAAAELGLTHEAYYRALAALARQGAIRRGPRRVQLLRPSQPLQTETRV
jgi:CRP-like cAMP-binding protein